MKNTWNSPRGRHPCGETRISGTTAKTLQQIELLQRFGEQVTSLLDALPKKIGPKAICLRIEELSLDLGAEAEMTT